MRREVFLQAALNGDRRHWAAPRTAEGIARDAETAVAEGARSVYRHAFDGDGVETLDGDACAKTLRATRRACPGIPISLTTSAAIVEDPVRRLEMVSRWTALPDLVTVNQGEEGILPLCALLRSRGVELEAGLLGVEDARRFVAAAGRPGRLGSGQIEWRRVLIEPLDLDPDVAVGHAAAIEEVLLAAGIGLEQVHHGYGVACWAVNRRAILRGHGIRTGLEDVDVLPDGEGAAGNAELVRAAAAMIRGLSPR